MNIKKHQEDTTIQNKLIFRDQYGKKIEGCIEYNPLTGWGKRIQPHNLEDALVEDCFYPGGSVEFDGQVFDERTTLHTEDAQDKYNAIKQVVSNPAQANADKQKRRELIEEAEAKIKEDKKPKQ